MRRRLACGSASLALPPVGCFSGLRVVHHAAGRRLVTAEPVAKGQVIFRFTGVLVGRNTGDRCLRVGEHHYLASEEGEPPWVFLNHSYTPSVSLSHEAVRGRDPAPPVLTATATASLPADAPLTIDYTLHEYVMYGGGFVCEETGRPVRGFHFLPPEEQQRALPRAMPFVKALHGQYLFGQESRC